MLELLTYNLVGTGGIGPPSQRYQRCVLRPFYYVPKMRRLIHLFTAKIAVINYGGQGEIRTPVDLSVAWFTAKCFRPLSHLSTATGILPLEDLFQLTEFPQNLFETTKLKRFFRRPSC